MKFCAIFAIIATAHAARVPLVSFDGASDVVSKFTELNDPVMGGKSTGTWSVNTADKYGVFDGEVVDVPSLKAPGFIKAAADGKFADASSTVDGNLVLLVRSSTPSYEGFRVSFASGTLSPSYACAGGGSIPLSRGCFKAHFAVPAGNDFVEVRVPFTDFSDKWSPATGEHTTNCTTGSDVCPTASKLSSIIRVEVWAEGALGKAHLEVKAIYAEASSATQLITTTDLAQKPGQPSAQYDTCKGPVQSNLKFGVSGRLTATVPVPVDANETLAESVCCDSRVKPFAEPQFLFEAPDIQLFSKLDANAVNTFYDTVCGIPLFRAPLNRSFAEFQADTQEHGWPSFRLAEVVSENVVTDKATGYVTSKCGTHLGSYLPDSKGPRWCMDLSCVSGNSAQA